jgi:endogenous inhibitor of DNA gyrase (YacG/DUF329 family)
MDWKCPICRKPVDSQTSPDFPFCSERCRLTDLGNWSSEKYKISVPVFDESELEDAERDSAPPPPRRYFPDVDENKN